MVAGPGRAGSREREKEACAAVVRGSWHGLALPGMLSELERPPVAMMMFLAVKRFEVPSAAVTSTSLGPTILPRPAGVGNAEPVAEDLFPCRALPRQDATTGPSRASPGSQSPCPVGRPILTLEHGAAVVLQDAVVDAVQAADLLVLVGDHLGPGVAGQGALLPTKADRVTEGLERAGKSESAVDGGIPLRPPGPPVTAGDCSRLALCESIHPQPTSAYSEPKTISFLGTQPRITQVPPAPPVASLAIVLKGISQTATLAP